MDLQYDPASFAGPFDLKELRAFEEWLQEAGEGITFDASYIDHLTCFHGGRPGKRYFTTKSGTGQVITRMLNFANRSHPLSPYSVEGTWGLIEDRLGRHLMPFAELVAGDFLCFDYREVGRPKIVLWFHELSNPDQPYVEPVADDFDDFIQQLKENSD